MNSLDESHAEDTEDMNANGVYDALDDFLQETLALLPQISPTPMLRERLQERTAIRTAPNHITVREERHGTMIRRFVSGQGEAALPKRQSMLASTTAHIFEYRYDRRKEF